MHSGEACVARSHSGSVGSLVKTVLLALVGLVVAESAGAQRVSFPGPPAAGIYHVDEAGVLGPGERQEIDRIGAELLAEHGMPLITVTLPSLASRGAAGYTIERYATELFNTWGIGSPDRNLGMLLLVSIADRRARIELGADWGLEYDAVAAEVMHRLIVPEFRAARYAEGILAGARGLDAMARGLALPSPRRPWWILPVVGVVILGVGALSFSLLNSGRSGAAWGVLAALAAVLLFLLSMLGRAGVAGGGGGSGGGGAFRGGSSRGGGASGSW
jgi:uncharacterized protein